MTRSDFLASIVAGAVAVKAVAETGPESRPKRLLALEYDGMLSVDMVARVKDNLKRYEDRYNIEFLVLHGGMRLVDPMAPAPISIQLDGKELARTFAEELRQQGIAT